MTDQIVSDPEHGSLITDACAQVQDITRAVRKMLADAEQADPDIVAVRALMSRIESLTNVTIFALDMAFWRKSTNDLRAIVEGAHHVA